MFTPLEFAAVGLTEEKATAEYGEDNIEVTTWCRLRPIIAEAVFALNQCHVCTILPHYILLNS